MVNATAVHYWAMDALGRFDKPLKKLESYLAIALCNY